MDGGQAVNINLDSPLDISSSDMLDNTGSVTLQHNWQRYQGKFLPNSLRFEKNGWAAGWNVHNFEYEGSQVKVTSVDIRRPQETKVIGRLDQNEYQLVKQQWNSTVDVENFWWINSDHILELDNRFFTLKRKTNELDDWNGDRFEKVYELERSKIIPASIHHYFVPNVYGVVDAPFITVQESGNALVFTGYNVRRDFQVLFQFAIGVINHGIGDVLNGNNFALNTYNALTADWILSKAFISSTIRDGILLIGLHVNNNFDQWTIVANTAGGVYKVIQGYGYVGLHGDLTGGQIPIDYFSQDRGFTGAVQPLSSLSVPPAIDDADGRYEAGYPGAIDVVNTQVVGTPYRQWYIQKRLHGIVSHLLFAGGGNFSVQALPITNNYTGCYKSPSFRSAVIGDALPQKYELDEFIGLFDDLDDNPFGSVIPGSGLLGTLSAVISAVSSILTGIVDEGLDILGFFIWAWAPRLAKLVYLQQTLGQYAYVHYNSSESLPEPEKGNLGQAEGRIREMGSEGPKLKDVDPCLSDHLTFDKVVYTQASEVYASDPKLAILLAIGFVSAVTAADATFFANSSWNMTTVKDFGRQFGVNAVANIEGMIANIICRGHSDTGLKSRITGIKSLDMFYSTSDKQHVYAGPGFVEHQFVADCVAQSSTDVQLEGVTVQTTVFLAKLSTWMVRRAIDIIDWLIDKALEASQMMGDFTITGTSLGGITEITAFIATIGAAWARVADGIEPFIDMFEDLLGTLSKNGVVSNVVASVSKHDLNVEGKHKYGEKNEEFLWPCWGARTDLYQYTDEEVQADIKVVPWKLALNPIRFYKNKPLEDASTIDLIHMLNRSIGPYSSLTPNKDQWKYMLGDVPFYIATCHGVQSKRTLPLDMVKIEGVQSFMPREPFRNENIGESEPVFAPSLQHDYIIDKAWDLSQYCTYGMQQWIACKDTKLIDCAASNMYVNEVFCGVASPYCAIEVKRGLSKRYMRPWAVTPNTLAFNSTGYNAILDDKLYHAFDGMSYRIVDMTGDPGFNKNRQTFLYTFQVNDRFKRSNIIPANELQGNFEAIPVQAMHTIDDLFVQVTCAAKEKGLEAGTAGEDKDLIRWAIPIFTEHVSTLPAAVKTLTAMPLGVVEGVTSLCTELMNNQKDYKAPISVDFTIGKQVYRATEEYICSVQTENGVDVVTDLVPTLGLQFIGATPYEAYFYSKSTRCYYRFTGNTLVKADMMERFRDIQKGYWDFVNQEVVMPCLMTYKRLNDQVEDKDTETDNIIVPVLSGANVSGEEPPPITTVFNDRSWYKVVSLPSGLAYQGPNRVIINRAVFVEYMLDTLKDNLGKWKKLDREKYSTKRIYPEVYSTVDRDVIGVDGWTHNQFVFVTSALGVNDSTDCVFEWVITFCWPIEMDLIYGVDNYAVVNLMGETMTPGGKQKARPTHVFLTKELFTRTGNYGYYSFKYQSKNGAGNRERLHIWSDQYIAISSIVCEYKPITSRRTEQLTQQLDVQKLKEL